MKPQIPRGVTISFTKDEIDWLSWVMTDVLGKVTHVPPHERVASKIELAMVTICALERKNQASVNDTTEPENNSRIVST